MASEEPGIFSVPCPSCNEELIIDIKTRTVLHHASPPPPPIADLAIEVGRLRTAGAERELAFQRSLEAERNREERMGRKFDELLRRARQAPDEKPVKDIDL